MEGSSKEYIGLVLSTPLGKPENEMTQVREARWKDRILNISSELLNPAEVEAALFLGIFPPQASLRWFLSRATSRSLIDRLPLKSWPFNGIKVEFTFHSDQSPKKARGQ